MNDNQNDVVSALAAGSTPKVPADGTAGETQTPAADAGKTAATGEQNYSELEKAFGRQGQELGEYRDFVKQITPLLKELDSNPKLVQAIVDKKIDTKLVEAILDGKVKVEEAQQVAEAHQQVKEEMGVKAYKAATPEEIEKRVRENLTKDVQGMLDQKFQDIGEQKDFEDSVNNFINTTPDFKDYADKVVIWLNEHPEQDDIQIAYEAVKGKVLSAQMSKQTQKDLGEAAKVIAANTGGGNTPSSGQVPGTEDMWDKLVSRRSNPNIL